MGKNEKTKKPKPKYNVWQNTAYMLSVAWDTRRSVPLLVVLLAVCTAGKTTAEMLISPAVLANWKAARRWASCWVPSAGSPSCCLP